ncbi:Mannose-6-phosphate isomerase, class I [Chitinophaga eiseniae]|uniref:fructokinase n=1 Tax=Chitinophaga eiseniae TaxID=634771 RepID=A0A1T4P080_9BACT|nr:ROK family protein [Chitinophaga eiseniae]SJZ85010.1 Mannose-6-phosphate isomerase, class I [Chitinophaga eiseniae]
MGTGKKIAIDIGGSHVSACIVDTSNTGSAPGTVMTRPLQADSNAAEVISVIAGCITALKDTTIDGIGIAMPGPFDYQNGISAITKVGGKFGRLFGLHVRQALQDASGTGDLPMHFCNDAHAFAIGARQVLGLNGKKTVLLTLGTGFGSAFLENGALAAAPEGLPSDAFFDCPFQDGVADDYFSTRWLLDTFRQQTGVMAPSVKAMAEEYETIARPVFQAFGRNLGAFLRPWLSAYGCTDLVIGGNIARAYTLFSAPLEEQLHDLPVKITWCMETERCILTGAAMAPHQPDNTPVRRTTQPVLPVTLNNTGEDNYTVFPSFHTGHPVEEGYASLAAAVKDDNLLIIDGYDGVLWEPFRAALHQALQTYNLPVYWYHAGVCLQTPAAITAMLETYSGTPDAVFGKRYDGSLADFFDPEKLFSIRPDNTPGLHIIYGTGAALTGIKGRTLYIDIPKNEIQYRLRAGSITNIGTPTYTYKRCYFADWPVLNKHKQSLLPHIDVIIDGQRPDTITWMRGPQLRAALDVMLRQPFRARPWFEAGVWGGDWMKKHLPGLNTDEVNYAWSFELITPENGIVLEGNGCLLEVTFDMLAFHNNRQLLGNAAQRFGTNFPIRFDFLDTFDGGNLSIQCHPRPAYTLQHFGEDFTQDETYYILDCEPDAQVYLGFQEDIQPAAFRGALEAAINDNVPLPVEKYVQQFTAKKHELYLIPNGTIHASGKNNMVLEISSTPYIFTFKMYDWLRTDLNGRPRPIHLDRAFDNLYFDRKGQTVPDTLISKPQLQKEWASGKKWQLPTHAEHFYTVDRYEFSGEVTIPTNGQCHICMLVEGRQLDVTAGGGAQRFQYAETFVIPAGAGSYTCRYTGEGTAMLVVAYVKDNYC